MASPVDTSVKFFRSTMPGAPSLTGAAGTLISLLDACLVNGFGLQTATSVTVAGGIATAVFSTNHAAAPGAVVLVAGATDTDLNGEGKVSAVATNSVSWPTTAADGTKVGTITVKLASGGWNKPFTGTNLAAYKSASVQANGHYLRVADTGTFEARVIGYENMTAISTGTGPFPTSAQVSGGGYWGKTYDAGAVAVPWMLVTDGRMFYIFICTYATVDAGVANSQIYMFGDTDPRSSSGDPFSTILRCNTATGQHNSLGGLYAVESGGTTTSYAPRASSGAGTSIAIYRHIVQRTGGPDQAPLPDPISGAVYLGRVYGEDTSSENTRYELPGLYGSLQTYAERLFGRHQTTADPATDTTYAVAMSTTGPNTGTILSPIFVDLSNSWR